MTNTLSNIAFLLVFLSLISRWITPVEKYWYMPFILSGIVAVSADLTDVTGLTLPAVVLLLVLLKLQGTIKTSHMLMLVDSEVAMSCFVLALHIVPGFYNIPVVDRATIKSDSIPYSLYFNYDKALAGVFLIVCFTRVSGIHLAIKAIAAWTVVGVSANLLLLFLPALALGLIAINAEATEIIWYWLVSNLLITCVAEEAFFRGLIQQRLNQFLKARNISYASAIAVFITALLFGIAHMRGGWFFIVTATVAGLIYGLVYVKTRRIETAILTHYFTNTVHILFFSYPMLALQ